MHIGRSSVADTRQQQQQQGKCYVVTLLVVDAVQILILKYQALLCVLAVV